MKAELLTPLYWINMGAVAITTLAGSRLLMYSHNHEWIGIQYFLPGLTVFFLGICNLVDPNPVFTADMAAYHTKGSC